MRRFLSRWGNLPNEDKPHFGTEQNDEILHLEEVNASESNQIRVIRVISQKSVFPFDKVEKIQDCENQFFSDYLSFLTQSPTVIRTQALEDTVIWSISHEDLNELYAKSATGLTIGKAISDAMFIRKQYEQINLLTLSPTDRYLKLIKERPEVFQRTSLKIVCSYLGITAESLSRIRKKIS